MDLKGAAAALPDLQERAMATLQGRRTCPVATYLTLVAEASALDLTSEAAAVFRQRFNGYYGVRRNYDWRRRYYDLFERAKHSVGSRAETFDDTLDGLHAALGRTEASFASKLVATLRPDGPVIDSVVRGFLKSFGPVPPIVGLVDAKAFYRSLDDWMTELSKSEAARSWAARFDEAFCHLDGAAGIQPMKKFDFLIWGGAVR